MDVRAAPDERGRRGRQSRVVLIPRRWDQVLRDSDVGANGPDARAERQRIEFMIWNKKQLFIAAIYMSPPGHN
jgi:hypothetical protein